MRSRSLIPAAVAGLALSGSCLLIVERQAAASDCEVSPVAKLGPGPADAHFGRRVSVDGDLAIVGTPHLDYPGAPNGGAASVFKREKSLWSLEFVATPEDLGTSHLGESVSLSGTRAIAGASAMHAVYFFARERGGWSQTKVTPSDGGDSDGFGSSVAIKGVIAVVGAPSAAPGGVPSGAAYVFRWDGSAWLEEQKLVPSAAAPGDEFGSAVSATGDFIFVGAQDDDEAGPHAGAAYVFRWTGAAWIEEQKLLPSPAPFPAALFGSSLSAADDRVVIGGLSQCQCAFVFRNDDGTWTEEVRLDSPTPGVGSFGYQVATSGATILVSNGVNVYRFRWNVVYWQPGVLVPQWDGPNPGDNFGSGVALDDSTILVGSEGDIQGAGSVYVYTLSCTPILVGDLNSDSHVSGADLGILLGFWGPCTGLCLGDLDGNGAVNGADLGLLLANWTG